MMEREFPGRQLALHRVETRMMRCGVKRERAVTELAGSLSGKSSPDGAQTSQQFIQVEGLDQVIICTEVERCDAVGDCIARCHDQDRQRASMPPQLAQHFIATFPGKAQIEQYGIVFVLRKRRQRSHAITDPIRSIRGIAQCLQDCVRNHRVVFDHQYTHAAFYPQVFPAQ
jgi:hypothetical protein